MMFIVTTGGPSQPAVISPVRLPGSPVVMARSENLHLVRSTFRSSVMQVESATSRNIPVNHVLSHL